MGQDAEEEGEDMEAAEEGAEEVSNMAQLCRTGLGYLDTPFAHVIQLL